MRIIIGISGASGVVMGYLLLEALKRVPSCETHLILTEGAEKTFACETDLAITAVKALADYCHDNRNLAACLASGSYKTDGMIVIPCSMKTLSGIVHGFADNLLIRAADVCLKEGRKVVLAPREMPFSRVHLRNLKEAADCGCTIVPPMLTFYNNPQTLNDQIDHIIGKILMQFGMAHRDFVAWTGDHE